MSLSIYTFWLRNRVVGISYLLIIVLLHIFHLDCFCFKLSRSTRMHRCLIYVSIENDYIRLNLYNRLDYLPSGLFFITVFELLLYHIFVEIMLQPVYYINFLD